MTAGVPYQFSPGQVAASAQVNANFAALVSYLNGLTIPTTPVTIANGGTGSTTAQAALQALGLAVGSIIPCTASISGQTVNLTGSAGSPQVQTYQTGTTYCFFMPSGLSGVSTAILIKDVTNSGSGLSALSLYDSPGYSNTQTLGAGQFCMVSFSQAANAFVLVNTPPPVAAALTARFAQFLSTATWTAPAGVTNVYATMCGGGGGGGACAASTDAGGGGGGGAAAYKKLLINVTPGAVYTINVGLAGTGGSAGPGGTGGTSSIISATLVTLASCAGGAGGAYGNNASPSTGGAAGGIGGLPGTQGFYFSGPPALASGSGGGCLLGAGAPSLSSGGATTNNGITPGEYGGGGSGGAGGGTSGGAGGPGYVLLEW
jgi:hypothetical protein